MLELIAMGAAPEQRAAVRLQPGHPLEIGRGIKAGLSIPWEPHLSKHHLTLLASDNDTVHIETAVASRNPVFVQGEPVTDSELASGDFFVVGQTSFHLGHGSDSHSASDHPEGIETVRFGPGQLEQVPFRDPGKRLEVLTRLPELIWGARSDDDLHHRLAGLVLAGVTHADAVAIVELTPDDTDAPAISVLHWDRRQETAGPVRPSSRLVRDAMGQPAQSILHTWDAEQAESQYTVVGEFNWAYCTPIRDVPGEHRAIYVAGRAPGESAQSGRPVLESDVKYTELIAEIVGAIRRVNRLERQRSSFRQFFAPPVLAALGDDPDTSLLEPRECDVTVMFCDLRDFSRHAETSSDDLIALLDRVSRIMGVITTQIHRYGGVTGDFQGDAALGFWGWPFPTTTATQDACRAALGIRSELQKAALDPDHPLAEFSLGIGLAHGRAVAGKIGTAEQVKVTVFGPVVNLASRLESLTRQLHVPILMDQATADRTRDSLGTDEARIRRLARVLPYGFETPHTISELLPPQDQWPELTDDHIQRFEQGVDHFLEGDWESAYDCLHAMPASDRAQDFLTMLITQHNRVAPADWDGIVRLPGK
jgi:adenylate cyclase